MKKKKNPHSIALIKEFRKYLFHKPKQSKNKFYIVLFVRSNLAEMEDLFYDLTSFAVDDPTMEGMSLVDTINHVKPNILIGKIEGNTTLFMLR